MINWTIYIHYIFYFLFHDYKFYDISKKSPYIFSNWYYTVKFKYIVNDKLNSIATLIF